MNDTIKSHARSTHLGVNGRNQFHYLDAIWEEETAGITEREMIANFKSLHKDAFQNGRHWCSEFRSRNTFDGTSRTWKSYVKHYGKHCRIPKKLWASTSLLSGRTCISSGWCICLQCHTALCMACLDITSLPRASSIDSIALHGTYEIANDVPWSSDKLGKINTSPMM